MKYYIKLERLMKLRMYINRLHFFILIDFYIKLYMIAFNTFKNKTIRLEINNTK